MCFHLCQSSSLNRVLSLVVLGLAATQAPAASITFEQQLTLSDNETLGPPLPGLSLLLPFDVTLPQFDPSIGTLTGVKLNATTLSESATLNLINSSGSPITASIGGNEGLALYTFPNFNGFTSEGGGPPTNFNLPANDTLSVPFGTFAVNLTDAVPSDFTPYIGAGTISGSVAASRSFDSVFATGGPFDLSANASGSATALFSVTYEYVPEPSSLALFAAGGVMLLRRRRSTH